MNTSKYKNNHVLRASSLILGSATAGVICTLSAHANTVQGDTELLVELSGSIADSDFTGINDLAENQHESSQEGGIIESEQDSQIFLYNFDNNEREQDLIEWTSEAEVEIKTETEAEASIPEQSSILLTIIGTTILLFKRKI